MNINILKHAENKTTHYFLIKEKVGNTYHTIVRYKNNIFNKLFLAHKKFDSDKELYIVPEFKGVEGYYYFI